MNKGGLGAVMSAMWKALKDWEQAHILLVAALLGTRPGQLQ